MSTQPAEQTRDEVAEQRAPQITGAKLGPLAGWGARTFAALAVRNFRLFYVGQGLSLVGTWMRRTALGWLVYMITGSMSLLGVVMALTMLPMFVFSPFAGSLADHMDKRRLIILTQVVATISSGLLALLIWTDMVEIWHVMVLAVLGGTAFAFEVPTRQAFVVEMVGRRHLQNAIALNSALVNGARVIGPALAGILMGWVGIAFCFLLDALSYVVVIFTLLALRLPKHEKIVPSGSQWQLLAEGAREVLRNRPVRLVLSLLFVTGVFGWSFQTLMPAIAQDVLHLTAEQYGALMALFGVGAICGALFTASRQDFSDRRRQLFAGVWLMVAGVLIVSGSWSFWSMVPGLLLAGFGGILFVATGNTVVQLNVEDRIRGRVMGIWALAFGGSLPIGSVLAGTVADWLSRLDGASLAERLRPRGAAGSFLADAVTSFTNGNSAFLTICLFGMVLLGLSLLVLHFLGRWEHRREAAAAEARAAG